MRSFQDAIDESGIARKNFRPSNRSCCLIMDLYDDWRKTIAPGWRSGAIVSMQCKGSVLHLTFEDGATMTVKLRGMAEARKRRARR
jgi:hypothetical protein